MTAGRTNHTKFAAPARNIVEVSTGDFLGACVVSRHVYDPPITVLAGELLDISDPANPVVVQRSDPCPSCDGDEYDEAAGECAECGFVLPDEA